MVILVNSERYACVSCIRGHRVKKCNHNDRQLLPIVKRGRQVSQCNHCRDLRKTNGTHVKCTCAIASTPNPINGCLCEVINSCSCVASHLQEMNNHTSATDTSMAIKTSGSCHTSTDISNNNSEPFAPIPAQPPTLSVTEGLIDDVELLDFLQNDLDKYISTPDFSFRTSETQDFRI